MIWRVRLTKKTTRVNNFHFEKWNEIMLKVVYLFYFIIIIMIIWVTGSLICVSKCHGHISRIITIFFALWQLIARSTVSTISWWYWTFHCTFLLNENVMIYWYFKLVCSWHYTFFFVSLNILLWARLFRKINKNLEFYFCWNLYIMGHWQLSINLLPQQCNKITFNSEKKSSFIIINITWITRVSSAHNVNRHNLYKHNNNIILNDALILSHLNLLGTCFGLLNVTHYYLSFMWRHKHL